MDLLINIFIIIYQIIQVAFFRVLPANFVIILNLKKKFCRFYISQEDTKLSDIVQKISNERPLFLLVNFKNMNICLRIF